MESKFTFVRLPLPGDDPKQCQPDISLAQVKLGWQLNVKTEKPTVQ